jgi:hypothetical protein
VEREKVLSQSRFLRAPGRRYWALTALAVAAVLATLALDADRATPENRRGALLIGELSSLSEGPEHGIVHVTVRPGGASLDGVLVGIAVDPSDPSGNTVVLAASRHACTDGEVEDYTAARKVAKATVDANGSAVWDDTDIVHAVPWREAKSLILIGTVWGDGQRRADRGVGLCGPVLRIKLKDVQVSG